jgi:hypothetical protein
MKRIASTVLLCALGAAAGAQFAPADTFSARSISGQFIVSGSRQASPLASAPDLATNALFVQLEPALLAVSCERFKQALWRELGTTAPWRGRIYLALHPAQSTNEGVTIISEHFTDGWAYRLELPDSLERVRFVRAMVQVLLREYANRSAGERSAEIPAWLTEGLSQQLIASREIELVLPPRRSVNGLAIRPTVMETRKSDPLEAARRQLREHPPLTLEELNWPAEEQFSGDTGELYRGSAQVFVNELLALNDGRACLRAMLENLPQFFNWQTAFLRAFRSHFGRQLDVEKWWALQSARYTGRDPGQTWTMEESWDKLDAILRTPVQIRASAGAMPARAEVPLQTIVSEWVPVLQTQVLGGKLRELELAQSRAAQELAGLVDAYRRVLGAYLQGRDKLGFVGSVGKPSPAFRHLVGETLKQLNALDARRQALRPEPNPAPAAKAEIGPAPAR